MKRGYHAVLDGALDFSWVDNRATKRTYRHGVDANNPILFIEHHDHEMFPVETGKIFAEELADIGGSSQRAVVLDRALSHERDAIDRYALRFDLGGTSWTSFCGEQLHLLLDTMPPL